MRNNDGRPFEHFFCPMLMEDAPAELMLGHIVNEKFEEVPEFKIKQRKDIDGWYGSMFEADFLTLMRNKNKDIGDLIFGGKAPRGLKPMIKAGGAEIEYYTLKDDPSHTPINEHTLLELNGKNDGFLRLALKKAPEEILSLKDLKWHSEVFGDFRLSALASIIKAAYLTLFWKCGYQYALSLSGRSVGHDLLGRFYLDNRSKKHSDVLAAAGVFFKPYIHMVRPVMCVGGTAPHGTIEDNRAFFWLGSSGRRLGIGVFVRTNDVLHMVLMPDYSDADGAAIYLNFLRNNQEFLWVNDAAYNETKGGWDVHPESIPLVWPKTHGSFDLSRPPEEVLKLGLPPEQREQVTTRPPRP
jgi:hypothetical protein